MIKKIALLSFTALAMIACNNDDDAGDTQPEPQNVSVDFNFTHNFDGDEITNSDFDQIKYVNEHGETLSLSKLVYLVSDFTFTDSDGNVFDAGDYNLIDVRNSQNLNFTPGIEIPEGTYTVSFTFGFDDEDNDQNYADLNTADGGWNVPDPLGGGYHYMRMEGRYTAAGSTDEVNYQYHTIRANRHSSLPPDPTTLELLTDTSFVVDLGEITIGSDTNIEIEMNVAEWFKNPNTWDLTELFTILMPNYNAQILMNENGRGGVFSLGSVTQ